MEALHDFIRYYMLTHKDSNKSATPLSAARFARSLLKLQEGSKVSKSNSCISRKGSRNRPVSLRFNHNSSRLISVLNISQMRI